MPILDSSQQYPHCPAFASALWLEWLHPEFPASLIQYLGLFQNPHEELFSRNSKSNTTTWREAILPLSMWIV
jgi:hypothetical protein